LGIASLFSCTCRPYPPAPLFTLLLLLLLRLVSLKQRGDHWLKSRQIQQIFNAEMAKQGKFLKKIDERRWQQEWQERRRLIVNTWAQWHQWLPPNDSLHIVRAIAQGAAGMVAAAV
jgi:hypothetical protein